MAGTGIGLVVTKRLAELMEGTCDKHNIPYQISGDGGIMGTDAGAIQVSRRGVAAALVSIPNRYMHSPNELVSIQDLDHTAELIAHTCRAVTSNTDFTAR